LLSRYKSAERTVYKKAEASLARALSRLVSGWKRFIRGGRQSVSILVVASTEASPKGLRVSVFGLVGILCLCVALVISAVYFSGGLHGARAAVFSSSEELTRAQAELDDLRSRVTELEASYKDFQSALDPIEATGGSHDSAQAAKLVIPPIFPKRQSEARSIAEVKASIDRSIPLIEEYGSTLGNMASVKRTVPAIWPINVMGHISTLFGMTSNPFTGQSYFHTGIDCSTYRAGDYVIATADGTVIFSGVEGGYGLCVIIAHDHGYATRYGHMSRLLVRKGQRVKQGQSIGILGNTGVSTAPHTHYEVLIGQRYLDPTDFFWSGARSIPIITGSGMGD
jgi:Membrane proteins related to metalloendopeptidases